MFDSEKTRASVQVPGTLRIKSSSLSLSLSLYGYIRVYPQRSGCVSGCDVKTATGCCLARRIPCKCGIKNLQELEGVGSTDHS